MTTSMIYKEWDVKVYRSTILAMANFRREFAPDWTCTQPFPCTVAGVILRRNRQLEHHQAARLASLLIKHS